MKSTTSAPSRFSQTLQSLRLQQGLTQSQLDDKIGRKPSFVRNLEAGINRPPDLATCRQIAAALGVSARTIWDAAKDERLRALDEDLYRAYVLAERIDPLPGEDDAGDVEPALTEEESLLLEILRWLDTDVPARSGEPLAGVVCDALLTVFTEHGRATPRDEASRGEGHTEAAPLIVQESPLPYAGTGSPLPPDASQTPAAADARAPTELAIASVRALRRFADYAPNRQAALLRVFVSMVDAAEPAIQLDRGGRPKRS